MIWRDGFWPYDTIFVVPLFYRSSHSTAYADTVAAHVHNLFFTVFVQIFCTQSFAVFGTQFEYLTNFDTACGISFLTAFWTWIFLGHHTQIIVTGYFKVTARIYVDEVECFFVCTANQICHLFYFQVCIDFYVFQTNRA